MISKIELSQVNFITDKVVVLSDSDYGTNCFGDMLVSGVDCVCKK